MDTKTEIQTAVTQKNGVQHPLHPFLGSDEDMRIAIQTLSDMVQKLSDDVTLIKTKIGMV